MTWEGTLDVLMTTLLTEAELVRIKEKLWEACIHSDKKIQTGHIFSSDLYK